MSHRGTSGSRYKNRTVLTGGEAPPTLLLRFHIQRAKVDAVVLSTRSKAEIQEMASIRKEIWRAMKYFLAPGVESGDRRRGAAGVRNPPETAAKNAEENLTIRTPRPTTPSCAHRKIADRLRRPARDIDLPKLALRGKRHK